MTKLQQAPNSCWGSQSNERRTTRSSDCSKKKKNRPGERTHSTGCERGDPWVTRIDCKGKDNRHIRKTGTGQPDKKKRGKNLVTIRSSRTWQLSQKRNNKKKLPRSGTRSNRRNAEKKGDGWKKSQKIPEGGLLGPHYTEAVGKGIGRTAER